MTKTTKKAAKKTAVAKRTHISSDAAIKPLVKENPCKKGTFCFAQVQAALTSKTVAEAQKKLAASKLNPEKRNLETFWLVRKGFITLKQAA